MVKFFTEALPATRLRAARATTSAFIGRGVSSFRDAAHLVAALPYGRGSKRSDHLMVLLENKGTCSTKHGLLALLAQEQNLPIAHYIGIYEMNGLNTPGVGPVLETNCLTAIPEAHCYLKDGSQRFDVSAARTDARRQPIERLLVELEVSPEQTGAYKANFHQQFMRNWMKAASLPRVFTFEQLWEVREACIHALEMHT